MQARNAKLSGDNRNLVARLGHFSIRAHGTLHGRALAANTCDQSLEPRLQPLYVIGTEKLFGDGEFLGDLRSDA